MIKIQLNDGTLKEVTDREAVDLINNGKGRIANEPAAKEVPAPKSGKSAVTGKAVALLIAALVFGFGLLTGPAATAQTISITGTSAAPSTSGFTLNGSITASNGPINGITNTAQVTAFFGGSDAGTLSYNWPRSLTYGLSLTNNDTFSLVASNVSPGTVVYYQLRVQDQVGEAWLSATKYLTTSTATVQSPDKAFRTTVSSSLSSSAPPDTVSGSNLVAVSALFIANQKWVFVASNHWRVITPPATTNKLYLTSGN